MKYFKPIVIFLLVSIPGMVALTHPGLFTAHDLEGHVIRTIEFDRAWADGNFPVRWAKRLNWGLGYPYFNFNYPLVYYLSVLLSRAGLGYESAIKLLFAATFPVGGWGMYIWMRRRQPHLAAISAGLIYTYVPYHFINVYVRGNMAEAVAIAVVPYVFWAIDNGSIWLMAAAASGLILLHNLTAYIMAPVLFAYAWISRRKISKLIAAGTLTLALTCFFWLPALFEKKYIIMDKVFAYYVAENFPSLKQLLYSPWGYGASNAGVSAGEMSFQVGIPQWSILGGAVIMLLLGKFEKKWIKFFLALAVLVLFLMSKYCLWFWKIIPGAGLIQFPWRLLGLMSLASAALGAELVGRLAKAKLLVIFGFLGLLFFNRNHWRANAYYPLREYWLTDEILTTTTTVDGEHSPIWQNTKLDNKQRFTTTDKAEVIEIFWKTNYHRFAVNSDKEIILTDRTVYYPGWQAYVDKKKVEIEKGGEGLLSLKVPAGNHEVEVKFGETGLRKFADAVSLVALTVFTYWLARKTIFHIGKRSSPKKTFEPDGEESDPIFVKEQS